MAWVFAEEYDSATQSRSPNFGRAEFPASGDEGVSNANRGGGKRLVEPVSVSSWAVANLKKGGTCTLIVDRFTVSRTLCDCKVKVNQKQEVHSCRVM